MRNLKKILALVLALVMTMSVMSVASAAKAGTSYSDDASITQYDESIQVLTQLGIFRGDDFGNFNPDANITRAEAAALVYRVISTDVNDQQTKIYSDYNKFTDVDKDVWFAGYVNFCANGQYIVGYGNDTFGPNANITGYQLLAIILRALGYGQNGEYEGTGWEIKTATDAHKLGITKNINESTLNVAQTRAAVAEMLFQGLTCTQTVSYSQLLGYTSDNALANVSHGTLGYENFKLRGVYAPADEDAGFTFEEMSTNAAAVADTAITNIEVSADDPFEADDLEENYSVIVTPKYGEPVSFWYADSIATSATGSNPAGEIEIRYNPVSSVTVKTTTGELYTAVGGVSGDNDANTEDGGDLDITLAKNGKTVVGGRGTTTEAFVVDGSSFVVVKNTYADKVSTTYSEKYERAMTLSNEASLDAEDYDAQEALSSVVSGLARNNVVIFNKYDDAGIVDVSTIHTATSKTVTLTHSYVVESNTEDKDNAEASYFLVGSTKYLYNCNALGTELTYALLDRDVLVENGEETQDVYFDDYGNVIYSEPSASSSNTGFVVVTATSYGGYDKDNGYWMNITGYGMDGKAVTLKGGFDGNYVYGSSNYVRDYVLEVGIYGYVTDTESGLSTLYDAGIAANENVSGKIYAGDPTAVDDTELVDSNTVFIIAEYNKYGGISGYTVKTGLKNVGDLVDAEIDPLEGYEQTGWAVTYIDGTKVDTSTLTVGDVNATASNDDGLVNLVLVMGAKQSNDSKVSNKVLATVDTIFYLVDNVPEKQFSEYNTYTVIQDGKLTTLNVKVDSNADDELKDADAGDFFTVDASTMTTTSDNKTDLVVDVTAIEKADIASVPNTSSTDGIAVDVLAYGGLVGDGNLWTYASTYVEETETGHIVLADNCKIYDLTTNEVAPADVADLAIDYNTADEINGLGYTSMTGIVADYDAYGFATVIYIVGVTPAD